MWLLVNFYPILMRPRGLKVLVLCVLADALESAVMAQNVHAPNANAQLLQASNEVSQASGENRASHGPPSGETRRGTSPDRAEGDGCPLGRAKARGTPSSRRHVDGVEAARWYRAESIDKARRRRRSDLSEE